MKKTILFMALVATVVFTGCSKDDDDKKCESCTAQGQKIEICENGDGTYSMTGSSEIINEEDLAGLTPKQLVDLACAAANMAP